MNETKRGRTYVAFVLDRSGSMARVKPQTVNGFNEQVQALHEDADKKEGAETFVSLITFNGRISEEFLNAPVDVLREMTMDQYVPTGNTALYEAIGYTITRLCNETDPGDEYNSYLVVILSDGQNVMHHPEWTEQAVAQRIADLEKTNRWTFTFIGSDKVGLEAVKSKLNFRNTLAHTANAQGTSAAFSSNAKQLKTFLKARDQQAKNFSMPDYFEGAKTAEELMKKSSDHK
jgi:uncharacterized protein YegL